MLPVWRDGTFLSAVHRGTGGPAHTAGRNFLLFGTEFVVQVIDLYQICTD